jgi:hypothetical protein
MVFLDDLAANATDKNLYIIIYSGNLDSLVAHRGSEGEQPTAQPYEIELLNFTQS